MTHPRRKPSFASRLRRELCRWLPAWLLVLGLAAAGCAPKGEASAPEDSSTERSTEAEPGGEDAAEAEEEDEEDLPPVETVRLKRGEIETVLRFSTNLEAESEVQVFSQAARLVTELEAEEGDRVKKGQLLLRLQDDEQRSALARVESQLKKARREYQRQQNLFAQELISEQAMNDATYEVEQLELAVEDARRDLGYTVVRAPISGTVTGRHVNLGDHITVNQHLFDIVDFDTIVARVYVPERELRRLRLGQTARLFAGALDGGDPAAAVDTDEPGADAPIADARTAGARTAGAWTGRVIRLAPIVDPRSGTVKATIGIPRNQGLLPGMYVEVELVTDVHHDALLVPKRAVIYDNTQAFLYRVSEDLRAERLRIRVLLEDREHIEPAPGTGLGPGDEIVVAGQAGLKSGVRVRRVAAPDAAAPGTAGAHTSP